MKILLVFFSIMMMTALVYAQGGYPVENYSSTSLVTKAWEALKEKDVSAVMFYTNKCIKLYARQARNMQEGLKDYPTGDKQNIFQYWALNDVGTALFILGEAHRNAGQYEEAAQAYKKLINEYSYAQCWDTKGWFWKPAEAAEKKLVEEEKYLASNNWF
jgi:tetratricopeptide (TPR) repeat protein